jgi:hypothetical protein
MRNSVSEERGPVILSLSKDARRGFRPQCFVPTYDISNFPCHPEVRRIYQLCMADGKVREDASCLSMTAFYFECHFPFQNFAKFYNPA